MIVQDGQTLLLGGILFQKDSTIEHKLPLFGDVPVVGGLFRHNQAVQANNEMFVFMTPRVINEPSATLPETAESRKKLDEIKKELNMEELHNMLEDLKNNDEE
jgi:type II secretory pathway component GspD/PulD (secretin)